jgi:hypothetical protein
MQAGDWAEQRLALAIQERSLSLKACEEWAQALQGAAQQAKMLEVWAHELETVNREQKQALDRIFNLPPVRAARYLRKRVSPRSPGTNGNPK